MPLIEELMENKVPRIPLEQIKLGTSNLSEIGQGGFSRVYKGELEIYNKHTTVAVKVITQSQQNEQFLNEIVLLSRCKHENIISLIGFCDEDRNQLILVYEYAVHGSLDTYLIDTSKHKEFLTWALRLKICIGVASGLAYLHSVGTTDRVIHRDIKSGNILIDEKLEAKIADFGLSKIGPANQKFSILVAGAAGTLGYLDPEYIRTGLLTKEVDVYAFGIVMFELLCGRLAWLDEHQDEQRSLASLVKESSGRSNLSKIVDPNISDEIAPRSLKIFTETAYQCLEIDRKKRPTMALIVQNLEDALTFQMIHDRRGVKDPEDEMYWFEKLPSCHREIMKRADSHLYDCTYKQLYSRLYEGILVDNGTKSFVISKLNEKICQKVSASEIFIGSKFDHGHGSRFSKAAIFSDGEDINMHCRVRSEMLSTETTYAAYLIFKNLGSLKYVTEFEFCLEPINHCCARLGFFPEIGDGDWREIQMWQFVSNGKNVVFEFELRKLSFEYEPTYDVVIEGVEFRPLVYDQGVLLSQPTSTIKDKEEDEFFKNVSDTELEQKLPTDYRDIIGMTNDFKYSTIKELYVGLRSGIFIDNRKKWFSLNRLGKKCCTLSARDLVIKEYLGPPPAITWKPSSGTRFGELAYIGLDRLEIRGNIKSQMLSLDTNYAVYLVFMHHKYQFRGPNRLRHSLAEASIKFNRQREHRRRVYIEAPADMLTLKNDQVHGVSLLKDDSMMELCIWPCFLVTEDLDEIEVGICPSFRIEYAIESIDFRPIDDANRGGASTSGTQL